MRLGLRAAALAGFSMVLASSGSGWAANERVHGCMSPAQAREVLIVQKFVAPFRALGEAAAGQGGEAVGLQLCLWGDIFVYDVTVLRRDGRVSHALIDARSGVVATLPRAGK